MNFNKAFIVLGIAFLSQAGLHNSFAANKPQTVQSPDGHLKIEINTTGDLSYDVYAGEKAIMTGNTLSIKIGDKVYGHDARLVKATRKSVNETFQPFLAFRSGEFRTKFHHREDVVLNGHFAENGCILGQIPHSFLGAFVHRQIGDILVVEKYLAGIGDNLPGNHIEGCGLAGTVGTEETDDFSLGRLHRDPLHHGSDTVFLDQIFATEYHRR